jgi:hypothetical protein
MDCKEAEIYKSFVQVKLDALKEKKFTDCYFMVGDDGEEQEVFDYLIYFVISWILDVNKKVIKFSRSFMVLNLI